MHDKQKRKTNTGKKIFHLHFSPQNINALAEF